MEHRKAFQKQFDQLKSFANANPARYDKSDNCICPVITQYKNTLTNLISSLVSYLQMFKYPTDVHNARSIFIQDLKQINKIFTKNINRQKNILSTRYKTTNFNSVDASFKQVTNIMKQL